MRRREFLGVLGGGAVAWPLAARAQTMPTIGFLDSRTSDAMASRLSGFRRGLKETGFVESENVSIVYRWAENQGDRLPALAAELVRRPVAVLVSSGGPGVAFALKAATTTIPVVFISAEDPVRLGLVTSLARPTGNLTGINFLSSELIAKLLEFLRELVPGATRVAALVNPGNPRNAEATLRDLGPAAGALGLQVQIYNASTNREIDAAFATIARERPDALIVGTDPFFNARRVQLALLAGRHSLPAIYSGREYAEAGGPDELRQRHRGFISSGGCVCRAHSQRRQARRSSGRAGKQIRDGHQPSDRTDAEPLSAADVAHSRRRGDRMKLAHDRSWHEPEVPACPLKCR